MPFRTVAAVAAAGVIGAGARWALTTRLDGDWALLIANVVGCAVIGWATARSERIRPRGPGRRGPSRSGQQDRGIGTSPWLAAGFCGALTSMSALALALAEHLTAGRVGTAGAWLGLTVAACAAAFAAGRLAVLAAGSGP